MAAHSITDFYFTPHRHASLGTMTVTAALSGIGAEVREFNFPLLSRRSRRIALPGTLAYLAPHIIADEYGPTAFFTAYRRLGPDPGKCAEMIAACDPDALLISSFAYAYAEDAIELAGAVRRLLPNIPIAVGGGGPSASPDRFLANDVIDYVVPGEIEATAGTLLDCLKGHSSHASVSAGEGNRYPGILTASAPHRTTVPEPAEKMIFPLRVLPPRNGVRRAVLSVSRGCSKRCAFCSSHLTHGRRFRQIPFDQIADTIRDLPHYPDERYHFAFEDDNLLIDTDRFLRTLELIRQHFPTATFSAENGMDYRLLDHRIVRKLVELGCTQFNLSIGSFAPDILQQQKRSADLDHLREMLQVIDELQVRSILYMIVGLCGDTPVSAAAALLTVLGLPADIGISPYYALPGLPGFREVGSPLLSKGSSLFPWTGSLTTAELMTAFRLARLVQLIKHPDTDRELLEGILRSRKLLTRINERKIGRKSIREVPGLSGKMLEAFFSGIPRSVPNRLK